MKLTVEEIREYWTETLESDGAAFTLAASHVMALLSEIDRLKADAENTKVVMTKILEERERIIQEKVKLWREKDELEKAHAIWEKDGSMRIG